MKIRLVKHHLEHKPGDMFEAEPGVCAYLVKMGVATDKEVDNGKVNSKLDKNLSNLPNKKK